MAKSAPALIDGLSAFYGKDKQAMPNPNGGAVGMVLRELTHQGKLNLRCSDKFHKQVSKIIGLDSNPSNNHFTAAGDRLAVWLGPDEVMILLEAGAETAMARQIKDAGSKDHIAVNDVTDALTSLSLTGPSVRAVLAKGCALDLHKDYFTSGMCAQTTLSHAGVTILCKDADEFIIICRTSFTDYLVDYLCDAALDCGYQLAV